MNKKFVSLVLSMLLFATVSSVAVTVNNYNESSITMLDEAGVIEQWNQSFGGTGADYGRSVDQTNDDGYIITGNTGSYGAGAYDIWLVKTDSNGTEQWNQTFGGADYEWGYSVDQTNDDGYIITGTTKSFGAGSSDFWLIKTDSNGTEQWNQTFGGTASDTCYTAHQTNDDGYILAGRTYSYGPGITDVWLIKTDSDGNEQWNQTFGGADLDSGSSVEQTNDDGYVIAGYTKSFGAGAYDVWLIKTDSDGNETWSQTFGGWDDDFGSSVEQTNDDGYVIAGYTKSFGAGARDVWLIKTDSNGTEQWSQTFGGFSEDESDSVQQTSDDGYIIAGTTSSYDVGGAYDFWLIKTISNYPPETPDVPDGPTYGYVGVEYTYTTNEVTDPDGHNVSYGWDWDDSSSIEWTDEPSASHIWNKTGVFEVSVQAKDDYDAYSEWSPSLGVTIVRPEIEIGGIKGGLLKVDAEIKNVGDVEINNISWSINVEGGLFGFINVTNSGTITTLASGSREIVTVKPIIGLGSVNITVTVELQGLEPIFKEKNGKVLFIFVMVV